MVLASEFEKHELSAETEVYEDAMHGWCVLDSPVYSHASAEKAWTPTLTLFHEALQGRISSLVGAALSRSIKHYRDLSLGLLVLVCTTNSDA